MCMVSVGASDASFSIQTVRENIFHSPSARTRTSLKGSLTCVLKGGLSSQAEFVVQRAQVYYNGMLARFCLCKHRCFKSNAGTTHVHELVKIEDKLGYCILDQF